MVTDHKPLMRILGPKKGVSAVAAARLQHWALLLSVYSFDIQFRSTDHHCNADALSRLPLPVVPKDEYTETNWCNIQQIQSLPVTAIQVHTATRQDSLLSKVLHHIMKGWPIHWC